MANTTKLWTNFNGQGFAAEYAEYAKRASTDESGNSLTLKVESGKVSQIGGKDISAASATQDASGNVITTTYATKNEVSEAISDAHTHSNKAVLDATTASYTTDEQTKLDGIETGAQVNAIESISANGTALLPDASKNVDIPLATSEAAGLIPSAEFGRIPGIPDPQDGADQVFSYDSDHSAGWQPITKEYVGNVLLDEQTGEPVLDDEDGTPIYDEEAAELWTAYKGTEFGARRAYEDHTGANIRDSLESKVDKVTGAAGKLPAFNAGGNLVDSGVPLESRQAADGGTDLSLVTTGEKYVWNNTRQLPNPEGHVNGAVLSIMSNSGTRNVQWDGESEDDFVEFTFPDGVEVGGKLYKAMQIGDLIWMTSNLAYAPAGYTNGYNTSSTPAACQSLYASHPEWGYMYNMAALNDLLASTSNWLPVGWRIPTRDDFIALGSVAGSSSTAGYKLKAVSGWYSNNGTDEFGFHGDPSGNWDYPGSGWSNSWMHYGTDTQGVAVYWTKTGFSQSGYNYYYVASLNNNGVFNTSNYNSTIACIRLVKDAPVEE